MGVIRDIDRSCHGLGNRCLLYFTDKKKIPRRTQHVHPITANKEAEIGSVEVSLLHRACCKCGFGVEAGAPFKREPIFFQLAASVPAI